MLKKASCTMLAVIVIIEEISSSNAKYLGSEPTKKYFFPWLVTFHRNTPTEKEFFGSGSIITKKWVIGSMDCFVRPMSESDVPFYQEIGNWEVHSGGIWGDPFQHWAIIPDAPWLQIRKVEEVKMFSNPPGVDKGIKTLSFTPNKVPSPETLNNIKRSPFGFSMSIALVKVMKVPGSRGNGEWQWTRSALPIPLFSSNPLRIKPILFHEFEYLEEKPFALICHVGGWRSGDWRLVEYEVVYVPLKQCRSIYCAYDDRACLTWPVNGTHVCFKSLAYTEPCWRDQGSALFCKQIGDTIVGILTSAPTCGYDGLPGVFTLIHHGAELLETEAQEKYQSIPKNDRDKYTPPPEEDLITAY